MKEFYRGKYNFAKVAKEFQLIEQETKTIFICKEPEAKEILDEIKTKGTSKERMRKAGQYCVQIYGDFLWQTKWCRYVTISFRGYSRFL